MSPEKAFGEVLREARTRRGLSQERLGFACGYHRTYISLLERGRHSPTLTTLYQLYAALGVRPSALLRRVEARAGRPARRTRA